MRPSLDERPIAWRLGMRTHFRGISQREGMLLPGPCGWAEWSPFLDYSGAELINWLRAADEARLQPDPPAVRDAVEVNATIPAVPPARAYAIAAESGCATAKVKVAEPGQRAEDDLDRVAAVRDALGPAGKIRVDANGAWSVEQARDMLKRLVGLEYAEQPCASVEELAALRLALARDGIEVPLAADESIRRTGDPERVAQLGAADIAVLKVQPLGGVRACLELADRLGLPVVVSSAVETSIGLHAGVALAAALPELPYACGLNTLPLLDGDLTAEPLRVVDGKIHVRPRPIPDPELVRAAETDSAAWQERLDRTRELAGAA